MAQVGLRAMSRVGFTVKSAHQSRNLGLWAVAVGPVRTGFFTAPKAAKTLMHQRETSGKRLKWLKMAKKRPFLHAPLAHNPAEASGNATVLHGLLLTVGAGAGLRFGTGGAYVRTSTSGVHN